MGAGSALMLITAVTANESKSADSLCEQGLEFLSAGNAAEAARAFRAAIAADPGHVEAHHGLVRALRDAGQLNQSVAAAMALTVLTPEDPLAHTALSISLQAAGHVPQAEAAAARARILEWKAQLNAPPDEASLP
jgi:thioredoxin-like negative regulator of GroEL